MLDEIVTLKENMNALKDRLKKVAVEKAHLQLIVHLMKEMSAAPGLDNIINNMLKIVMENIGGLNVIIYYKIDEQIYYADVYGNRKRLKQIEDSQVKKVFACGEFIECEHDFSDTKMLTPPFPKAATWVFPLKAGIDVIGVFKMEKLHIGANEYQDQLPVFFNYAALLLKNEILGQTRLQQAYEEIRLTNEKLVREMAEREKIQNALELAHANLEYRVEERTHELSEANAQLRAEITERRQAESLLAASEEKFSKAFSRVADIIGIVRLRDEKYVEANEAFFRLLGYRREEIIEHASREFGLWFSEAERERVYAIFKRDKTFANIEAVWCTKTRLTRVGLLSADWAEIEDEECIIYIWHDITDRKRAEEELRQAHDQLEFKVVERTQKLSTANQKLVAANEKLRRLTIVDGLTGIANRRYFDEYIMREWYRGLRNQTSVALIMADIDFFKSYNDSYGHLKGDDCLKIIASILTEYMKRSTDLAARYGGEEFALVMPDTDLAGAVVVAENIRTGVAAKCFENQKVPGGIVTMSLGVSSLVPCQNLSPLSLIALADEALYSAKQQGRNRVVRACER